MTYCRPYWLTPTLALTVALVAAACSSPGAAVDDGEPADAGKVKNTADAKAADSGAAGEGYVDATTPQLTILPLKAFSGFDGTHTFRVPIAIYGGGKDLTLTASDAALAQIDPTSLTNPAGDDGTYFMVTVKGAGSLVLTASTGGKSVTARFEIASYPASNYAVGEGRYKNGAGAEPPCTKCHSEGGIDHSPAALASATDGDILRVILSGVLVAGNPITTVKHKWTVTDAEKSGLVTYLRALPPRGFEASK